MLETSSYSDSQNLGVVTLPGQSGCQTRKAIQIRNVDLSTEIGERIQVPPKILVSYVVIGGPYFGVSRTEPPAFLRLITIVSWEGWEFEGRAHGQRSFWRGWSIDFGANDDSNGQRVSTIDLSVFPLGLKAS